MDNKLIQNLSSQTASLIGNLNLQIAQLMTQNQQLQSQIQDLQTKLNMTNKQNQKSLKKARVWKNSEIKRSY